MTAITANLDQLMRQAPSTVHVYLLRAAEDIDSIFGEGYASKNPQLVGAYIQAASADFAASCTAKVIGEAVEFLADMVDRVADAIDRQHP